MKILVTGATGQVGRRFVPRLLQHAATAAGGTPADTYGCWYATRRGRSRWPGSARRP